MAPGSEPLSRGSGHAQPSPETHSSHGDKFTYSPQREDNPAWSASCEMRRTSINPTFLEHARSGAAACGGNHRTAGRAKLSLSPRFCYYVGHRMCSFLEYVNISSKVQHMLVLGFGRLHARGPVRSSAFGYMNLLVTAAIIFSCTCKAVIGLAINGVQPGEAGEKPPYGSHALLFAESLHGDDVTFVEEKLQAALSSGTPFSDMAAIAGEAASLISWSECSRFCSGGIQTANSARALELAVEGLRRVFSSSGEWSDSYVDEVKNRVAQLTMEGIEGNPAAGQPKTRPCNTFACPFEVPSDLKTANLQIAREAELVASFGVVPQVDFTDWCKDRLMLDQLDQETWTARRTEHENYRKVQERAGEVPGWEATVLAPKQLNLYSCITLCRLHHKCNALTYAKDIDPMEAAKGESVFEGVKGDALTTLKTVVDSVGSVVKSLDENLAKLSALDANSVKLDSQSGSPVCTLYTGVKVSRVAECGTEPTKRAGKDTLSLLILNLDTNFGDVARLMRISLVQQQARMREALSDANLVLSKTSTNKSQAVNVQHRAERLMARLIKASQRAQTASHILSEAAKVMEGAAVDAVKALRAAQSEEESAAQTSLLNSGATKSSVTLTNGLRQAFYSATPLCASDSVFSGVELLNRGCAQLPALQTHASTLTASSSVDATKKQQTIKEASLMTWQNCREVLHDVTENLEGYRSAVSRIKASGEEDALDAVQEAKRLVPQILGLTAEETAKLSLPDISDRLQAETGFMSKDFAKLLDEKDNLELRRQVVERLGEGTGTVFAVFDTAKRVCEIRAVFEPRRAENGNTLGAQFPTACALFSPFSLLFLPAESSDSGSTAPKAKGSNGDVGTCEDVPCTYSPWTSWSPCEDIYQVEAYNAGDRRNSTQVESDGAGPHRPAMWQVRVKETLARPKMTPQCNAALETQLCKDRITAGTEASGLMGGFTAAITKSISSWCIYGPYSEWSECSPQCASGGTTSVSASRTRTRAPQQHPVPGLAPKCDTASLKMQKSCGPIPNCSSEEVEEGRVDEAGDGFERGSHIAYSAIHLHSYGRVVGTEASSSGRMLFNSLSKSSRSFQARIPPNSDYDAYVADPDPQVRGDNAHAKPIEDVQQRFMDKSGLIGDLRPGETVGLHLKNSDEAAVLEDEPVATAKESAIAGDEGSQNPDGGVLPVVEVASEDDDTIDSALGGYTIGVPFIEGGKTQNLTLNGSSVEAPSTEDERPQDPSIVKQARDQPATIPYDSPFIEYAPAPIAEENHGSTELSHPQSDHWTNAHDSSLSGDTPAPSPGTSNSAWRTSEGFPVDSKPAMEARVESTQHTPEGDTAAPESFFLGLSRFSFFGCCLFGALASTVLVLIAVVCSRRIRSWLGYDWSGATEEECMALLKKQADSHSLPAAAPLVNPDGIKVLKPDGEPLVVTPCLNHSGGQYVTTDGSKVFVTLEGGFVNSWGRPVQANDVPNALLASVNAKIKADAAQPKKPFPSRPIPKTSEAQEQASGISVSKGPRSKVLGLPEQAATAQGKRAPFGTLPQNLGPIPKPAGEVRRSDAVPHANAKKPGMPPPKPPSTD